ncbi:hypothetical protein [Chitinophaga filiformis]|uniref:Uncharacterized protein n=1 Tax=Chitinophaga filiformis TaxID=104663 RepID=A0A1G7SYT7_CHIFI|nr:hypothetical protein [Chitinophaga filiformis]SDG28225.1 hypothetical protein SAMN04488121_1031074 [Chitinophaga filiformis]
MIKFLFLLLWGPVFFIKSTQAKPGDTLVVKAIVTEIYPIDNYIVVKAEDNRGEKFTILSPFGVKTPLVNKNEHNYKVKVGKPYPFVIEKTTIMKGTAGSNMFLPLGGFVYNGRELLERGKLPYNALNMCQRRIYY